MGGSAIPRLASEVSLFDGRRLLLVGPRVSNDGDLVVFLWVGAGNGAMNGYAAVVL